MLIILKCAYVVLVMVVYWCMECAPLPATALIPLFAYPFTGVLMGKQVCGLYFKDVIVLFLGGLTLAIAIEGDFWLKGTASGPLGKRKFSNFSIVWNLHKRIALFVLNKVGTKPPLLLAGFMGTTSFISMWMSNVASTAMMAPIGSGKNDLFKNLKFMLRCIWVIRTFVVDLSFES